MEKVEDYTTARSLGELLDHLDFFASTYDHESREKRFSNMKNRAEELSEIHNNLLFTDKGRNEFIVSYEFNGDTIGVFIGEFDEIEKGMTFTLRGRKTLGAAELVETVAHTEKLDRGTLELVPERMNNPFRLERGLLSIDTVDHLFFKLLNYMVHITRP